MPNSLRDNTYFILDTSATALAWPTGGARIQSIVLYASGTAAAAVFLIDVGSPIFKFNYIQTVAVNSGITMVPSTFSFPLGGVRFQTAWIPSTLTSCSAWIHFV